MIQQILSILDIFPLKILPESGLSHSPLTTVFIGLIFMTFFTESLGWVYTGLIVPGYLAPILISQPWAGVVIIFEAILTYLLVRLVSDYTSKLGIWSNFFGRDRFFAFLIFSVIVRIIFEWLIFPTAGSFVVRHFDIEFDYRNYLYSVGLVIVPLLANMFWKPGLFKSLLPVSSVIGFTYLVTKYILLPGTNFSVAKLELFYEDIAIDFLSSPRTYIILLLGALIASRTNLIYGWDYGGILVPSLLALAWFTPIKIILTFVEAILIVLIGKFIVNRKFLETTTIEGPRKTLLVFTLGFILKFIIGHISSQYYPGFKATDLYGFGYLLPSLIALRIWEKVRIGHVVVPILRTSILAVLVGSLIGLGLMLTVPTYTVSIVETPKLEEKEGIEKEDELYQTLMYDKTKILSKRMTNSYDKPYYGEMDRFKKALELIDRGITNGDRKEFAKARFLLKNLDYQLIEYHDKYSDKEYIYLREKGIQLHELRGWGVYIFNLEPSNDLIIEVPRPRSEWKTLDVGEVLFEHFDAKALLVAGAHYKTNNDGSADVLRNARSIYHTVHKYFRNDYIVQVRGVDEDRTSLWVKRDLGLLNLKRLENLIGEYQLKWESGIHRDLQRKTSPRSFITLELSRRARRGTLSRRIFADAKPITEERKISGYLMDWFAGEKDAIAGKHSQLYKPPSFDEILYMDEEVIQPVLEYQAHFQQDTSSSSYELSALASSATILGYELIDYTYVMTGERYLILREIQRKPESLKARKPVSQKNEKPDYGKEHVTFKRIFNKEQEADMSLAHSLSRSTLHASLENASRTSIQPVIQNSQSTIHRQYWGTYVFKLGNYNPTIIEVPHPLSEINTFEMGVQLFEYLDAQALLIAGAHKDANTDSDADVIAPKNLQNIFHLIHQVILREGTSDSYLTAQIRGFADYIPRFAEEEKEQEWIVNSDIVLSLGKEIPYKTYIPESVRKIESIFHNLGYSVEYFDGAKEHIRFAGRYNLQYKFTEEHNMGAFLHVWVNRDIRNLYRSYLESDGLTVLLKKMGIQTQKGNLYKKLLSFTEDKSYKIAHIKEVQYDKLKDIIELFGQYSRFRNVAYLLRVRQLVSSIDYKSLHFVDKSSNQEYMIIYSDQKKKQPILVINLHPKEEHTINLHPEEVDYKSIYDFIQKRQQVLIVNLSL